MWGVPLRTVPCWFALAWCRKTLLQRADREYPPSPLRGCAWNTNTIICCERPQDNEIHLLWATRRSLNGSNVQASAIWAEFELATRSHFEAVWDPTRFWFCPGSPWTPHAVLMGQALQDGAVWHEINAMAVGNYISSKPSWKHGNSLWLRTGSTMFGVSFQPWPCFLHQLPPKALPLIHFVHEASLGNQSRGDSKRIQRTFVVRNRKILIKLLLGTGAQLESLQIQIATQLVTWRWKTVIVH